MSDSSTVAGGSGNSDFHREQLTHAKSDASPVIFWFAVTVRMRPTEWIEP